MKTLCRGKRNKGYMFIDVLIALLIFQICLAAAIGLLSTHAGYLVKIAKANGEIISTQNDIIREFSFVYDPEQEK